MKFEKNIHPLAVLVVCQALWISAGAIILGLSENCRRSVFQHQYACYVAVCPDAGQQRDFECSCLVADV